MLKTVCIKLAIQTLVTNVIGGVPEETSVFIFVYAISSEGLNFNWHVYVEIYLSASVSVASYSTRILKLSSIGWNLISSLVRPVGNGEGSKVEL